MEEILRLKGELDELQQRLKADIYEARALVSRKSSDASVQTHDEIDKFLDNVSKNVVYPAHQAKFKSQLVMQSDLHAEIDSLGTVYDCIALTVDEIELKCQMTEILLRHEQSCDAELVLYQELLKL